MRLSFLKDRIQCLKAVQATQAAVSAASIKYRPRRSGHDSQDIKAMLEGQTMKVRPLWPDHDVTKAGPRRLGHEGQAVKL